MSTFKILSIDGGGIKGLFPASFLASIEEATNSRVANHFDLIAGTSTGGIIALGLGLGFSARELQNFYEEHGQKIFAGTWPHWTWTNWCRSFFVTPYDSEPLRAALKGVFKDCLLGHSRSRLLIPAMNATDGQLHVFKTQHHSRYEFDHKMSAIDVAMATSAAPTYFKNHETSQGLRLLDGGVWANNPTLVAVIEAVTVLGVRPEDIRVLSIGCTDSPFHVGFLKRIFGGKLVWARDVAGMFMKGQSESAQNMAELLVGHNNIYRIQKIAPEGIYELDDCKAAQELTGLGYSEARKFLEQLRQVFLVDKIIPFIPPPGLQRAS